MITLDTSAVLALLNRRDAWHAVARSTLRSETGPVLVPTGILSEIAYMLDAVGGSLDRFLAGAEQGQPLLDCGEGDVPRIRELIRRYGDLPLGFADTCVVVCAERNGGRVLTFDRRDFDVVAGEGTIMVVP